jgi:hypothetical protein
LMEENAALKDQLIKKEISATTKLSWIAEIKKCQA